jgi:hypothetical protein
LGACQLHYSTIERREEGEKVKRQEWENEKRREEKEMTSVLILFTDDR